MCVCVSHQVARCEMDSDFLAKAALHVDKAQRQDYGGESASRFVAFASMAETSFAFCLFENIYENTLHKTTKRYGLSGTSIVFCLPEK